MLIAKMFASTYLELKPGILFWDMSFEHTQLHDDFQVIRWQSYATLEILGSLREVGSRCGSRSPMSRLVCILR